MNTHTDEKRYLTDLAYALRLRKISGVRIGEILAEVEAHTAESGQSAWMPSEIRRSMRGSSNPLPTARVTGCGASRPGPGRSPRPSVPGCSPPAPSPEWPGRTSSGCPGGGRARSAGSSCWSPSASFRWTRSSTPGTRTVGCLGRRWFMSWLVGIMVVVLLIIVGVMLLLT